jgi:hypothetical protein
MAMPFSTKYPMAVGVDELLRSPWPSWPIYYANNSQQHTRVIALPEEAKRTAPHPHE